MTPWAARLRRPTPTPRCSSISAKFHFPTAVTLPTGTIPLVGKLMPLILVLCTVSAGLATISTSMHLVPRSLQDCTQNGAAWLLGFWCRVRFACAGFVNVQFPLKNPRLAEAANVMRCLLEILAGNAGDNFLFLVKRQGAEAQRNAVGARQAFQSRCQVNRAAGVVAIAEKRGIALVSIQQPLK